MNAFLFTVNAVTPLLLLIAIGFAARKLRLADDNLVYSANRLVFRIFLPALLLSNVYHADFNTENNLTAVLLAAGGVLLQFTLLFLVVPRIVADNKKRGVIIQGAFRSNYAMFGVALLTLLYPGTNIGIASLLAAVCIPIFNALSVVALSVYANEKASPSTIFFSVLKNPLIISTVSGLLLALLGVQIPKFIDTALNELGKIASPLSLVLLGAAVSFEEIRGDAAKLAAVSVFKMIFYPLCMVMLAVALGLRGIQLAGIFALFAAPTAVSSFPMAQQLGGDDRLAGGIITVTTLLSVITVFVGIYSLCAFDLL